MLTLLRGASKRAFLVSLVLSLSACAGSTGTYVPPATGVPPGYMEVAFDVAGPLKFTKYQYLFVLNTSGNGLTPEASAHQTNWQAYSFMLQASGNGGSPIARAIEFVKNPSNPKATPAFQPLITTPQQFAFTAKSGGAGTEFTILFQRSIFSNGLAPQPPVATTWLFNAFTVPSSGSGTIDSMGSCPSCFASPKLPIGEVFAQTIPAAQKHAIDPSAEIVSIAVANNP